MFFVSSLTYSFTITVQVCSPCSQASDDTENSREQERSYSHSVSMFDHFRGAFLYISAFREAGATTQMILLPGTDYASAKTFVSSGSADALSTVQNPDGTFTNLIMDVHKYLDYDSSLVQPFPCSCLR
jgi:hypothetical protein